MASSPPPPPLSGIPSSSTVASRDVGKATANEATVLTVVSSTRVLHSARCTPSVGGSSSQPNPPEVDFETPSETGNDVLPPFDADTYVPLVHIIGRGGSLRYRPLLGDVPPEVLHRELEQHFGFTNVKVIFLLPMILFV